MAGIPADRVGRYRLDGVIGVGSFATVHRAVDDRLEATVVVKILAENHSLNPEIRERFITEGRSLRKVSSPYVVAVHDIGESPRQQPYLILEYADRGTLGARVATLRRAGWTASSAEVLTLARQLGAALEGVHSARLVHRDLSPANILLTTAAAPALSPSPSPSPSPETATASGSTAHSGAAPQHGLLRPDERVLVADLGMCKDLAVSSGLTVAGGTNGFRPPEMDAGPAVIDTRADLWSLSSLMAWVCEDAELPPALTTVLDRGRAPDPADRHPDVATWLREVETALDPPTDTGTIRSGSGDAVHESAQRRRLPQWSAALLAALLIGLLGGWLVRGSGAPPVATQTARIAIEGPETIAVGQNATFTLRHLGVESWVWVLPTGQHRLDQESVTLTPSSPGTAVVTVTARDASGRDLRTDHRVRVTE